MAKKTEKEKLLELRKIILKEELDKFIDNSLKVRNEFEKAFDNVNNDSNKVKTK